MTTTGEIRTTFDLKIFRREHGLSRLTSSLLVRRTGRPHQRTARLFLVLFLTCFLAAALASQRFFYSFPLAGLQVERVTLYFFDYVLGLYLPLEPSQRVFEGFTLLKSNFRQRTTPPHSPKLDSLVMASIAILSQVDYERIFIFPQKSSRIDICIRRGANELVGFMKPVGC